MIDNVLVNEPFRSTDDRPTIRMRRLNDTAPIPTLSAEVIEANRLHLLRLRHECLVKIARELHQEWLSLSSDTDPTVEVDLFRAYQAARELQTILHLLVK